MQFAVDQSVEGELQLEQMRKLSKEEMVRQKTEAELYKAERKLDYTNDARYLISEHDVIQKQLETQVLQRKREHVDEINKQQMLQRKIKTQMDFARSGFMEGACPLIIAAQMDIEKSNTRMLNAEKMKQENRLEALESIFHEHTVRRKLSEESFHKILGEHLNSEALGQISDEEFARGQNEFRIGLSRYWDERDAEFLA
jgi:hypothetical protein